MIEYGYQCHEQPNIFVHIQKYIDLSMIVHCWHRRVCNRLGCHHPVLFWYRDSRIHHRFYAEKVMNLIHRKFCTSTIKVK